MPMKTNRRFLQLCAVCILMLLCRQELQAQQKDDRIFLAGGRHSLGVNLYPVVANLGNVDKLHPFELTYKLQVKDSDRAWRFGVLGQYDNHNHYFSAYTEIGDPYEDHHLDDKQTYFLGGGAIGHEWQSILGKRWLLAWGADLGYSYQQTYDYDFGLKIENTQKIHTIFIKAFMEINFAITRHLIVNAGVSFVTDYKDDRTYPSGISSASLSPPPGKINLQSVDVSILPFRQIGIGYIF